MFNFSKDSKHVEYVEMTTFLFPNKQSLQEEILLRFLNKLLVMNYKSPIICIEDFYVNKAILNYTESNAVLNRWLNYLAYYFNFDNLTEISVETVLNNMIETCGYKTFYMVKNKRVRRCLYVKIPYFCIK